MVYKKVKLDSELVNRVLKSSGTRNIDSLCENNEHFQKEIFFIDNNKEKLEEIYINLKSILNDYKTNLYYLPKINKLLGVIILYDFTDAKLVL